MSHLSSGGLASWVKIMPKLPDDVISLDGPIKSFLRVKILCCATLHIQNVGHMDHITIS